MTMGRIRGLLSTVIVGLLAVGLLGATARATGEPDNLIKYRQTVMSGIGAHIGAIAAVVKGEVPYAGHVAEHARALHAASLMVPDLFPPDSDFGITRAKPEIWEKWAEFETAIKAFQDASATLAEAANSGDMAAVGAALGGVGKSCGGCHKPFRAPKE
jgi:cytochrome c556